MKKRNLTAATAFIGLALAIQGICAAPDPTKPAVPAPEPSAKEVAAPTEGAGAKAVKPRPSGKVVESIDAGGYTYISLEKDGKKSWVAVPVMKVAVGQELELPRGVEMGTYTSKSLNRTFENITFTTGPQKEKGGAPAPQAPHAMGMGMAPATQEPVIDPSKGGKESTTPSREAPVLAGKVVETMDSGGYSYICLEKNGKKSWVAAPAMQVAVGDEVKLQGGMEMINFKSKSLKRTFESIVFSEGPVEGK